MAHKLTISDKKVIKLLEKIPLAEEKKNAWLAVIADTGITSELTGEIQAAITELEGSDRTRFLAELSMVVKQWRLADQSQHFHRR